jgi:hypothetical protein
MELFAATLEGIGPAAGERRIETVNLNKRRQHEQTTSLLKEGIYTS